MKPIDTVKLEADMLQQGDRVRIHCPWCNATDEKSMLIVKDYDNITTYKCFRGTCPGRSTGRLGGLYVPTDIPKGMHRKKNKEFKDETIELPKHVAKWLKDKYQILAPSTWTYIVSKNRLVMPILNEFGYQVGTCTKKLPIELAIEGLDVYDYDHSKKSMVYWTNDSLHMHYTDVSFPDKTVVIVEDILSAEKMSYYTNNVALLCSDMTHEQAKELSKKYDTIVYALDPDMNAKMIRYKDKYSLAFKNSYVLLLDRDPKDTDMDILHSKLRLLGVI